MARRIKRFFIFLLFPLVFSLISGRTHQAVDRKDSGCEGTSGWNSAQAGVCC